MTNVELELKIKNVQRASKHLVDAIQDLVGSDPAPAVQPHAFAVQFHLQDALNRISNITMLLAQRTEENVEQIVADAQAKGKLHVLPDARSGSGHSGEGQPGPSLAT